MWAFDEMVQTKPSRIQNTLNVHYDLVHTGKRYFHHVRVDFGMFLANEFKITAMNCLPAIAEPIGYFITGCNCPESEVERVEVCLDIILQAANELVQEGRARTAIVFDNLGNLFRYNEDEIILRTMQTWAKAAADVEVLNIVFMSNEGKLKLFFNEVSESSRMATYHL